MDIASDQPVVQERREKQVLQTNLSVGRLAKPQEAGEEVFSDVSVHVRPRFQSAAHMVERALHIERTIRGCSKKLVITLTGSRLFLCIGRSSIVSKHFITSGCDLATLNSQNLH